MAEVAVSTSLIHGLGVFAAREFTPGETILTIDDSRIVDDQHPLRPELGEHAHYCDYLADGKVVLMQTPERHINSNCDPNTFVRTTDGVRTVMARRTILAGEEIGYDYIIDCHGGVVWHCNCGAARCRRVIVSSFFELPIEQQQEYLPLLSDWFIQEHREKVETLRRKMSLVMDTNAS